MSRRAPTVAEFEASLGLTWFFELSALQRQILCNIANLPQYSTKPWDELAPSIRLAIANAALILCEVADLLARDLER